jgi:NhaA family Na+:H+ antiporter
MPLFALVTTNIRFESSMIEGLTNTLGIGVILGLLIGKPLGIFLFSFTSVKAGFCTLPSGAYWQHIVGLGVLGGIGFTISIFVANLSFTSPIFISQAKFAILIGSVLAGLLGYIVLRQFDRQ